MLFLKALVSGLAVLGSVVAAQDRRNNTGTPSGNREITTVSAQSGKFVQIIAKRTNGTDFGAVRLALSVNGYPSLRAGYYASRSGNATSPDARSIFSYRVSLVGLVEFNDTVSVQDSTSRVNFKGSSARWSAWERSALPSGVNQFITRYLNNQSLSVNLTLAATPIASIFGNRTIAPDAAKFSLDIANFPYTLANSRLAVVMAVHSREIGINAPIANVSNRLPLSMGKLTWDEWVMADGRNVSISLTRVTRENVEPADDDNNVERDERTQLLVFRVNAVQPRVVNWDPEMGVSTSDAEAAASQSFNVSSDARQRASLSYASVLIGVLFSIFFAIF